MPQAPATRHRLSLDMYAVALALIAASLVRFNLIPTVRW